VELDIGPEMIGIGVETMHIGGLITTVDARLGRQARGPPGEWGL
jgi:hypothetical protein